MSGMERGRWQTAEFSRDLIRCNVASFRERFSRQDIREGRTRSNRRHAALSLEASHGNRPGVHTYGKPKNIAADGICDFHDGRCPRQVSRIVRVAKMVEDGVAEHRGDYKAHAQEMNSLGGRLPSVSSLTFRFLGESH